MKEAIVFCCFIAVSIGMYMFGQKDNMEDVTKGCDNKNQFIVDSVIYQCYSFEGYKEEENKRDITYNYSI